MKTDESNQNPFLVISVLTAFGFLMTIGFILISIIEPNASQFHVARNQSEVISAYQDAAVAQFSGLSVTLDTFFLIGYTAIFYGLYLLSKDENLFFSRVALSSGIATAILDLLENAILTSLIIGIPRGYQPDNLAFVLLWSITYLKDAFSYVAAFTFVVLLVLSITTGSLSDFKSYRIIFVIILAFYVFFGVLSFAYPELLLIRDLGFVVDMLIATILFFLMSKKHWK